MSSATLLTDENLFKGWVKVDLPVPNKPYAVSLAELKPGDKIRTYVPLWQPKKKDGLATPPGYSQINYIPQGKLPSHVALRIDLAHSCFPYVPTMDKNLGNITGYRLNINTMNSITFVPCVFGIEGKSPFAWLFKRGEPTTRFYVPTHTRFQYAAYVGSELLLTPPLDVYASFVFQGEVATDPTLRAMTLMVGACPASSKMPTEYRCIGDTCFPTWLVPLFIDERALAAFFSNRIVRITVWLPPPPVGTSSSTSSAAYDYYERIASEVVKELCGKEVDCEELPAESDLQIALMLSISMQYVMNPPFYPSLYLREVRVADVFRYPIIEHLIKWLKGSIPSELLEYSDVAKAEVSQEAKEAISLLEQAGLIEREPEGGKQPYYRYRPTLKAEIAKAFLLHKYGWPIDQQILQYVVSVD